MKKTVLFKAISVLLSVFMLAGLIAVPMSVFCRGGAG